MFFISTSTKLKQYESFLPFLSRKKKNGGKWEKNGKTSQAKKLGEFIKGQRTVDLEIINSKPEAGITQMSVSV